MSCFSKTILQEPVARADAPDGPGSTFLSNLSAYPASLTLLSPVWHPIFNFHVGMFDAPVPTLLGKRFCNQLQKPNRPTIVVSFFF
jgi:hypothetical protein